MRFVTIGTEQERKGFGVEMQRERERERRTLLVAQYKKNFFGLFYHLAHTLCLGFTFCTLLIFSRNFFFVFLLL